MENKNFYDAAVVLVNNMSASETKRTINYMSRAKKSIVEEECFNILKNSSMIFGGVGKCLNLMPIGVYIEGWFLPRSNYDVIEVYYGKKFLGNAKLGIARNDVYRNFAFYNEKNAGFSIMISNVEFSNERDVTFVLKKAGKIVKKVTKKVEGYSVNDEVENLKKNNHETNNILVPTLTNRIPMILKIAQKMPEYNFVTLMEGMETKLDAIYRNCQLNYHIEQNELNLLSMNMVPTVFFRNMSVSGWQIELTESERKLYEKNEEIKCASENFSTKYNTSLSYAIKYCCTAVQYAEHIIEQSKAKGILVWNMYSPWHMMLIWVARKKGIPVIFMENGLLPGTLIFETQGQMGESYPAVQAKEFKALNVTHEEVRVAAEIIKQLYGNKLNRWTSTDATVYDKSEKQVVLEKLKIGRPTILYAGQNDFESGMFPYTDNTKRFHSPIFESSEEAAIYLAKLAEKNDWNFIYKRHPMMRGKLVSDLPDSVIISDNIDIHDAIDIADLTITILSQTSYVAMIRNKPALMLGYHQIKRKGCAYEVSDKNEIENTIQRALNEGFTSKQKVNFQRHVAQLCKYYLYRDFTNSDIKYGKSLNDLVLYISDVINSTNESMIKDINMLNSNEKILEGTKEIEDVSDFELQLSVKERLSRKKMKYQLCHSKYRENVFNLIRDYKNVNEWYKTMMYISQFDLEILEMSGWNNMFLSLLEYLHRQSKDEFICFIEQTEKLHSEIKKRLCIEKNICQYFVKLLETDIKAYIDIMTDEDDVELAKKCLKHFEEFYQSNSEELQNNIVSKINEILREDLETKKKIYLLEWLWNKGAFDDTHMKLFHELLLTITDASWLMYYGVMELAQIAFVTPNSRYKEYYLNRKKFLAYASNIMLETNYSIKKQGKKIKTNKKIAMLVTGLHGKLFASTRLQVGLANELSKRGYEVTIFVTDTNYADNNVEFLIPPKTIRRNFSKSIYKMDHCIMVEPEVNIIYFTERESAKVRFNNVITKVYEYDPKIIIDITNENAIYNPILKKDYKIISVPLNDYSTSSICDAYISRNYKIANKMNTVYGSLKDIDCIKEANLYLPYDISEKAYARQNYGFGMQDKLIVTVGNRLDYEITNEVECSMKEFLDKNPDVKWILVGIIHREFNLLKEKIASKQVVLWGYERNISALYKMCDIYLNLPRSGGGGSVACAVQSGIPALIINMPSDIMPFFGEENALKDWKTSLKQLEDIKSDKNAQHRLARAQYKNLMEKQWKVEHFVDVIEQTMSDLNIK